MRRERIRILNVNIDNLTMDELLDDFDGGLLLTLHVDMIMKLQKDREFYALLPQFDVITCDSQILFLAAKLLGTPFRERVSGSDYFPQYCRKHKNNAAIKIYICGGAPGVAELARKNINARAGRDMIVGTCSPPSDYDRRPEEIENMIALINQSQANVLVVGLGGGRQEKFVVNYRDRLPGVKTFLPLGGTIDYEAGTLSRPPAWITNAGFEWLYRVLREPRQRWRRYFVHQPPALYLLCKQKIGCYQNPFGQRTSADATIGG
jgi:N-acetylglucosaminyldiphosphoundecaprenol N-acetyl-beta-D-mannosaminyltransferase